MNLLVSSCSEFVNEAATNDTNFGIRTLIDRGFAHNPWALEHIKALPIRQQKSRDSDRNQKQNPTHRTNPRNANADRAHFKLYVSIRVLQRRMRFNLTGQPYQHGIAGQQAKRSQVRQACRMERTGWERAAQSRPQSEADSIRG
jgi:hypothetical protein